VLAIGGGLLLGVLAFVVRADPNLLGIDAGVAGWAHRHATTFSTHGLNAITQLGTTITALVGGTAIVLLDYRRTHTLWAIPFLFVVVGGEKLVTTTIKDLADRVRPSLNPVAATLGPSFPSGHSASAAAFFAAAALLVGRHQGRRGRAILAGLAAGIAVAVAMSRVMLDVHWLTDVVAGLALGWAWFAVSAIAFGGRLLRFGAGTEIAADAADTEHRGPPATAGAG
jgi:undecaprenyl-diphosphatase